MNGGPGEIRTPDHAAAKGFPRVRRTFSPGSFPNRAELPAHENESSGVFG